MLNGKSTRDDANNVDIDGNEIDSVSLHNEISNFNVKINLFELTMILFLTFLILKMI